MAISTKDLKILYQRSGNRCAFDDCGALLTSPLADGEPVVLGHVAHIVGQSRRGPRGEEDLPDSQRDLYANLVLLCAKHHKIVDSQPDTYTAARLTAMKERHEHSVEEALAHRLNVGAATPPGVTEMVHSNLLAVTAIPRHVYSATTAADEAEVRERAAWPATGLFAPFVVRGERLYSFTDPGLRTDPFFRLVDPTSVQREDLESWWANDDGRNWFLTMFNRCLLRHCRTRGLAWDHEHKRFYFEPEEGPEPRTVGYQPLNQKWAERKVVYRPKSKKYGSELGVDPFRRTL